MRRLMLSAVLIASCSSTGTAPPSPPGTDSGVGGDVAADVLPPDTPGSETLTDASSSIVGCDLPEEPTIRPHECVLYTGLSKHDADEITTKCVSPGKLVTSCSTAGLVGICQLKPPALGQDFFDKAFDFKLTDGQGIEDQYRYDKFGESECLAASGTWTPK